jgi:hypothetical protein
MTEQLSMFEPTGPEVLALAQKHQKDAQRAFALAESLGTSGWNAASHVAYAAFHRSERLAAEMYMLAEFEALGDLA